MIAGRVFALDIDPTMVAVTGNRAKSAGLTNVMAGVRDFIADGSGPTNEQVGYAMLFNILHIENPIDLLREAHRVGAAKSESFTGGPISRLLVDRRCQFDLPPNSVGHGAKLPDLNLCAASLCAVAPGIGES
jgi:hypothetical protein